VNTPIQGSAADIMKKAMIDVTTRLSHEHLDARLILQVHDELIFEVSPDDLEKTSKIVKEVMEKAVSLRVPLRVSIESGSSWGEMH
jgi:DNA polymerase-1